MSHIFAKNIFDTFGSLVIKHDSPVPVIVYDPRVMAGGASYRKRNYRSAFTGRRSASVRKARSTVTKAPADSKYNAPVYKKLKRRPLAKTKVTRNTSAITTLARQVKQLQNQHYGELQTNTQWCYLHDSPHSQLPTSDHPIAFLMNSFYDEELYFGTVANSTASFLNAGQFLKQTLASDLDDQYEWNARRNSELVSPIMYKPVFTRLNFRFNIDYVGIDYASRIRITILKVKDYKATNKIDCALPNALGAYRRMAQSPADYTRNYFDKQFHDVLYDKWIKITPSTKTSGETDRRDISLTIPWKFKDDVYRPDFNDNPVNQKFWTNVPTSQQMWCMISVDSNIIGKLKEVHIGRFNMWRDAHGTN